MFNRNKMEKQEIRTPRPASGGAAVAAPASGASTFTKVINWILVGLVFVVPFFFLPFTAEVKEFNKQTLIFLSAVVMMGIWVIRILTTRSVSWVKTSLDYVLLAYIGVYLVSSVMSIDQVSSFLGYYGRFTGSFLSVVSLIALYYIIVNNVRSTGIVNKILAAVLTAGALVIAYSLLQVFGVHVLPFDFTKTAGFNPLGSLVGLGIFTALILVLIQWAWLVMRPTLWRQIAYALTTVAGLVLLFLINAFTAWLILALSMIVFLAFAMVITANNKAISNTWIWRPLLVLVFGILFVAFQFLPQSVNPRSWVGAVAGLPVEIQLSNSATWEMTKNALSNHPVFGYGPGTTGIAFGQIKPETLNQSIVWNLNFDRASSELANIAIETGLLGVLAFEATAILFLLYAIYFLLKQGGRPGRLQAFGLFMVWLGLYITHFFYFFDTTMYFLFWVTLALFVAITHWQDQRAAAENMSFSDSPRSALSWMFASLLMLAVLLVGGFFQSAVYFADVAYTSGLRELRKAEPNLERAASLFRSAIQRNQYRDVYYLAYGQNLVFLAATEVSKENPDAARFQNYIVETIGAGNSATEISPNKASNWASRGQFYSQIRSLSVPGADDLIIASAEEAVKKDENSPVLWLQLGQAYSAGAETIDPSILASGQDTDGDGLSDEFETALGSNPQNSDSNANGVSDGDEVRAGFNPASNTRLTPQQMQAFTKIDQDKLRKAEEALKKSISLKNDLPNAYIALARVYERWDKAGDARRILEEGIKVMPNSVDIRYELGRVVFNQGDLTRAEGYFNDVIRLVPEHANSHYSLGLLALQRNDRARALEQFKKTKEIISSTNQSNPELDRIIDELESNPSSSGGSQ